jgi:two-component system OmpR family response regulator
MYTNKEILIFLVDDDLMYLKSMEALFSQNPILVIKTFSSGEECVKNLSQKPDVIVLDYFLNAARADSMNGLDTLLRVKQVVPETQVIMLSSKISVELAVQCIKLDAFDFVTKDENTFSRLKTIIKQIFNIHSEVKELLVWEW